MRSDGVLTQERQFNLTWICQADTDNLPQPEQENSKLPTAMAFLTYAEDLLSRPPRLQVAYRDLSINQVVMRTPLREFRPVRVIRTG